MPGPTPGQKTVLITGYVSRIFAHFGHCPPRDPSATNTVTSCTPGGIGHALCLEFHNQGKFTHGHVRPHRDAHHAH